MDKNRRAKMPPAQRAKQFMPFEAVTGLQEALREKEREHDMRTAIESAEKGVSKIQEYTDPLDDQFADMSDDQ